MRWLPLESNPEVMNAWSAALGLSTDLVSFSDVYGLDEELLALVPTPVFAVLMLFPISKEYENEKTAEHQRILNQSHLQKIDLDVVIFIKQTIGNACGTIGLLHALANNPDIPISEGALTKFFEKCKSKNSPTERAKLLENDLEIANVHSDLAQSGQSKVPEPDQEVDLHFVCFVKKVMKEGGDNRLIELDGRKEFPIDHGPIPTSIDLLHAVVPVVKKFISLSNDNLQFNLIALCQNPSD